MATPTYFTIEGDYRSVVADIVDDADYDPQQGPVSATVTFTPQLKVGDVILAITADPRPIGYIPAPIVGRIDVDGQVKLRVDVDYSAAAPGDVLHYANLAAFPGTGSKSKVYIADDTDIKYVWNGARYVNFTPVRLLADTPMLGLTGQLIYEVKFTNVTFNAKPGIINSFFIAARTTDSVLNIITEGRVPGTTGQGITRGSAGAPVDDVALVGDDVQFYVQGQPIGDPLALDVTGVPVDMDDITDATTVGKAVTRSPNTAAARTAIGLGNVDNTSDVNKPVSTAQQAALDTKSPRLVGDGPFGGIATMLRRNRSAIMQGFGDSTMSGPGRAFDMMGIDLSAYPEFDANMWYMPFDDANKTYFNPTALRTSPRGVRGVGGTGGKIAGTYQGKIPVGDITIDMMVTMPSWTPAATSELLTKWDEAIAGAGHSDQKGLHFGIGTTGLLYFGWTTDGVTTVTSVSTVAVPFAAGNPGWVKVIFQANDGSGNNTVKFYTSSNGFGYAQLGSTVTTAGTVTSVYQSTTPYQLLSRNKEFATNHAPIGTYVHFLRVRDSAGNDYVPLLPDKWDPNPTSTLEPVYNSGAPILLCPSGAISGWNLANLTDPARYTQLMSLRGADMIIVDDGHNENSLTQRQFIDQYVSYIRRIKRSKPLVPIVCTTQNPYDKAGSAWTSEPGLADLNPTKMASMAKAMAGESGVWVVDTVQAFTNPTIGNDLSADGRHPSAAGYQKKADFTRRFLLPKAF
jgi:hypothetical protein